MKYVAWYTKDTVYEDIFYSTLKPSLDKYKLDTHVVGMPNLQKWSHNVAQKPSVVLHAMHHLKEPFVLLDVDCAVTGDPTLFNEIDPEKYDIAFHTLDWSKWYNRPNDIRKELLTGTMWFNYNDEVMKLLFEWHQHCDAHKCADQIPLETLITGKYKHLRVYPLPLEYCYINTMPRGGEPFNKVENPIITHYQASREAKRGIL